MYFLGLGLGFEKVDLATAQMWRWLGEQHHKSKPKSSTWTPIGILPSEIPRKFPQSYEILIGLSRTGLGQK